MTIYSHLRYESGSGSAGMQKMFSCLQAKVFKGKTVCKIFPICSPPFDDLLLKSIKFDII